jgi:hypothetical protein
MQGFEYLRNMAINQNCIHEEIQAMFATIQVRIFYLPVNYLQT